MEYIVSMYNVLKAGKVLNAETSLNTTKYYNSNNNNNNNNNNS